MGTSRQRFDEALAATAGVEVVPSDRRVAEGRVPAAGAAEVVVYVVAAPDGHHTLDEVAAVARQTPTLLIGPSGWPYAQAALAAGASAYLTDDRPQVAVDLAVAAVRGYRRARPPAEPAATSGAAAADQLSPREREALFYIAHGYTHQQAAARMGVKKPTVDTFLARIRVKLGVGNKAELTRAAMTHLNLGPVPLPVSMPMDAAPDENAPASCGSRG
ncbi:helix-turn-helix transcriptional regulator [Actinoplanes oblitus]|uniref:Helix-turn-helix transcriptional regulator n=1 Tax=Actinoplanes oblitus TaxID=3040509 RepID=A0ABY8WA52_9ACTN|nr:helix-turn-helix transcriptional regulator [Actinoplanes oblitus]WIM94387.1 helix-turn-helix transcriptional regulator [Actinoplanes oblitus]